MTRLGQHFLTNTRVAERQVAYANLTEDDVVLEIGPGNGVLTKIIAQRARVVAIEIDTTFIERLSRIDNVVVINQDVMKVDLGTIGFNKVISNIPYHISSPITFRLLKHRFVLGILMYQQEFAKRLVASTGTNDYSRLTVMASFRADLSILEHVSRESFQPQPRVDSSIVKIVPIGARFHVNEILFDEVVRALFSYRRKTVKNALGIENIAPKEVLEKLPEADTRGEMLSPMEIADLCNRLEGRGYEKTL